MRRRDSQPGYEVGQTLITCRWVLGAGCCGGGALGGCAAAGRGAGNVEGRLWLVMRAACVPAFASGLHTSRLTSLTLPPHLYCLPVPLRWCSPGDTLHEVLDKIVGNRLHRVYVCGEGLVPCGVVTLTDILHILVGGTRH